MKNFLKGFAIGFGILAFFILGFVSTKLYDDFFKNDEKQITRTVEVSQKIAYDTYLAYPNFSASRLLSTKESLSEDEKTQISKTFEEILKLVSKSNICTGGSYSLWPNVSYKDGLSVPSGYRFDANFECKFSKDDFQNYKQLLQSLNKILENNEYLVLNIPAIKTVVSDEVLKSTQEKLYDEIYDKSNQLASHYSKLSEKICLASSISYELNNYSPRLMNADAAYDLPIEKEALQTLKATVVFKCN